MKAEGKMRAAANAEARERKMKESYEDFDPFDDEGREEPAAVPRGDVPGSEEEEVPAVLRDVAVGGKTQALRFKFL